MCRSRAAGFDILSTRQEVAMKYVILIWHNPNARELWEQMPIADREVGLAAYAALNEDLEAAGEMVVSAALADPALAKRVRVRDGETVASDGPFAEVKEHLAGFYLIDCDGIDRAIAYAARIPEAAHMDIEVRPVLDRISADM
jgi:hypothetical protein